MCIVKVLCDLFRDVLKVCAWLKFYVIFLRMFLMGIFSKCVHGQSSVWCVQWGCFQSIYKVKGLCDIFGYVPNGDVLKVCAWLKSHVIFLGMLSMGMFIKCVHGWSSVWSFRGCSQSICSCKTTWPPDPSYLLDDLYVNHATEKCKALLSCEVM